jgi:hypothetical protein
MAWVKLDDQLPHHPKFTKISPAACWMWICAVAYCQRHLTDGVISHRSCTVLAPNLHRNRTRLVNSLVRAKLFLRAKGGYRIHDYLDHNPSRASVLQKRAEDAKRKLSARNPRGVRKDSTVRPRVPSHPIPKEHDLAITDTDTQRDTEVTRKEDHRAPREPLTRKGPVKTFRLPDPNPALVVKIAHEVVRANPLDPVSEWVAKVKDLATSRHIAYRHDEIHKAVNVADSALQRES